MSIPRGRAICIEKGCVPDTVARGRRIGLGPLTTLFLALTTGCTPPPSAPAPPPRLPVERNYRPPEGPPPAPPSLSVEERPERAIELLAEALAASGSKLGRGTRETGEAWLVLTSSGDPEPFLDCGTFEAIAEDGRVERVPAARLAMRLPIPPAERREVFLRQLRLDGRLAVSARPEDGRSRIDVVASYVLTRTVDRVALDGRILESQRETVAFETGRAGRFDQGLICRPTGRLEDAVIEAARKLLTPVGASAGDEREGA
jgi:hypothetical protein